MSAPLPEHIGPYRIEEVLGAGGMGVVYRARHEQSQVRAALKTVLAVDAELMAMLRREIHALSRIDHPDIVRLLDRGVVDGRPWYAMELIDGSTLSSKLNKIWSPEASNDDLPATMTSTVQLTEPIAHDADSSDVSVVSHAAPTHKPLAGNGQVQVLLDIFGRLSEVLSYLHGEGFVHGDLKPANVLLREDGSPVLGDFGLTTFLGGIHGREVLEVMAGVRGTVAYMAPEQIRGRVDARADLYSLGCMLYEALVGQPPFVGSLRGVMQQHLRRPPVPPSAMIEELPDEVEAAILKLLAKKPTERLPYASDLGEILKPYTGERTSRDELPPTRAYLYHSEFVAREEELRHVRNLVSRCTMGMGSCVYIGGESGVGKTRFVTEIGLQADNMGCDVIVGHCSQGQLGGVSRGPSLQPLLELLDRVADRCRERGAEETERLLGQRGSVLALYARTIIDVPGSEQWQEPARLAPDEARRRLFDYLLTTFKLLAEERPFLLILDDLQWCDELTLAFLDYLSSGRLTSVPVCVLGTYRGEELSAGLRQVIEAKAAVQINLSRLDAGGVGKIVRDMLALHDLPEGFVQFLTDESEGNPFFVAEYLRTAVAENVLYRNALGRWTLASLDQGVAYDEMALPHSLIELIELRLADLSTQAQHTLEVASVLGRDMEATLLERSVEIDADACMDGIEELVTRHVIEYVGPGKLRFLHHKLREITYPRIESEMRGRIHLRAANAIASDAGDRPELLKHGMLAHHWARGGMPDKAVQSYTRAGDIAVEILANAEALDHYRAALGQLAQLPQDAEAKARAGVLHSKCADILTLTGRQDEARQDYALALAALGDHQPLQRAELHRKIGKTWEVHHEHEAALGCYAEAAAQLGDEAFAPEQAWWSRWIELRLDHAWIYYWRAEIGAMQTELDAVTVHLEAHGTPLQQARFFDLMANLGHRRERYMASSQTVEYSRRAFEASQQTGEPTQIAEALFELGFSYLFHGDIEAASGTLIKALEEARRIGDLTREVRCLTYLTWSHRRIRRKKAVVICAEQSLEAARESGIGVYVATSLAHLAWVDLREGRHDEAERRCREALAIWRDTGVAFPFLAMAAFPLSAVLLGRGSIDEPIELVRASLAPDQGRLPDELTEALQAAIEAHEAGQGQEAREALMRALKRADKMGHL